MRPRRLGGLILFAVVLLALLSGLARAAPPIWRVSGAKGTAVLFGSVHLLPTGFAWRSPALDDAVARADELWFEIPIGGEADARVARLLQATGRLPPGDTLGAHLPPGLEQRLLTDAAGLGLTPEVVVHMKPWLADATLSIAADALAGAQASEGVERQINALAPATKRRRALESARDQVAVLAGGSMAEQIELLGVTLTEIEEGPLLYRDVVEAWRMGDLTALRREVLDPLNIASPRAYRSLITGRNRHWAGKIERRLRRSGAIVVVVGVGHLIGPESLPDLLRADGLTVHGP